MSADKYPSTFPRKIGTIVLLHYSSNIFRNTRSFESWGLSLRYSLVLAGDIQSRGAFRPIAREQNYLMD